MPKSLKLVQTAAPQGSIIATPSTRGKQSHNIWFEENKKILEESYLKYQEPWMQSGFSGPEEKWIECRKPIADYIDKPGTFLDIGCANGYLLECVLNWVGEKGIEITPYGLDFSEKLVELAKQRIPEFSDNLYVGNAFYWKPVIKFDFVRTELVYVPDELKTNFMKKLLQDFVNDNGKLLVADYRSSKDDEPKQWINEELEEFGYKISDYHSGYWERKELTRAAIVLKEENKG